MTLLIEQYNRSLLIIQKIEDKLPMSTYLKIEDAREAYLEKSAQESINSAQNLEIVHNIGVKEVEKQVGNEYVELKAIEILSDLENGLNPETKEKIGKLERQLAVTFEKKMLRLPRGVRERKLQNYINYSYGNPLRQVQAFDRMQDYLSDRELILSVERLKEVALERLADRVFELDTKEDNDEFLDRVLDQPEDLKVLALLQMYVMSGNNDEEKKEFAEKVANAESKVIAFFGKNEESLNGIAGSDVLDLSIVTQIEQILANSPDVSDEIKEKAKNVSSDTLQAFIDNVSRADFVSSSKSAYNPVSGVSDVRLLSPNPQVILLLKSLQNNATVLERQKLNTALRAHSSILGEYLLLQINDPNDFEKYIAFIDSNPSVRTELQRNLGSAFFTNMAKKQQIMAALAKIDEQKLFETVQRFTQKIFLSDKQTDIEKGLPVGIQEEILKLKKELPNRNIPQLTLPEGVVLPDTAKLSDELQNAIIQLAKARIRESKQSEDARVDLTIQAKDLGVGKPIILPGNLLYPLKSIYRKATLFLTFNPINRANLFVRYLNEKTLEAAALLERNQSRETIGLVLSILDEVRGDFEILKSRSQELSSLKSKSPEKVDALITKIIDNGLARQTLFAAVENKVYGEDFVRVEKIRAQVLSDGISTLLLLSDNNAEVLVNKLEASLEKQSGSHFKELKAIELLTEIKRTQPREVKEILEKSEARLSKKLEEKLLAMPKEERSYRVLGYVSTFPGNPVRKFEAYEQLKDNFTNAETILLLEALKDKAVEKLQTLISEIDDASVLQEFTDQVVGNQPEDLRIMVEIELRVSPSTSIAEIKAKVEENIIETYKDDTEGLANADFFSNLSHIDNISVVDVEVAQELRDAFERTGEVSPEVVETVGELENQIIDQFIENASNIDLVSDTASSDAIQIFEPIPQIIETLVALQDEVTPEQASAIDNAIQIQVQIIEEYLTTVDNLETLETYIAQIEENPIVAEIIQEVGGAEFSQTVETVTQELTQTAADERTLLEETIAQIEEEIFSSNNASTVETLPETVQQEITEISTEIPANQIPDVTIVEEVVNTTTETIETVSTSIPEPTIAPIVPTVAPVLDTPAPVVPGL